MKGSDRSVRQRTKGSENSAISTVETQRQAEKEKLVRTLLQTGWCQCIAVENGYSIRVKDDRASKKTSCCALTDLRLASTGLEPGPAPTLLTATTVKV